MATRFGFVTCVQLGRSCIETVLESGGNFDVLVTLDDGLARSKSGRVYLDDIAAEHEIPLEKIRHINDPEAQAIIKAYDLDWLFVIGWSQILSEASLRLARKGVLGMHPTLLPVGRGRASIPWAIIKGLEETGVTLFQLDGGVDTGPILAQQRVAIASDETATRLYEKVDRAHQELMTNVWADLQVDDVHPREQDSSLATEWPGRRPEDGRITEDMTVDEVDRLVRATTRPYPGAFFDMENGQRIRVWSGTERSTSSGAGHEFRLKDGSYFASEYEYESTPDWAVEP